MNDTQPLMPATPHTPGSPADALAAQQQEQLQPESSRVGAKRQLRRASAPSSAHGRKQQEKRKRAASSTWPEGRQRESACSAPAASRAYVEAGKQARPRSTFSASHGPSVEKGETAAAAAPNVDLCSALPADRAAISIADQPTPCQGASVDGGIPSTQTVDPRQLFLADSDAGPSAGAASSGAFEESTWPDLFGPDGRLKRPPNRYVLWQRSLSAAQRKELSDQVRADPDSTSHKHMVKAWNDLAPDKRQRIDAQYDALARRFRDTVSSLTASGQEHRLPKAPVRNKEATRKDSSGPSGTPKKKTSRDTASVAPSPRQLSASLDSAGLCTSPQDCGMAEQSVASSSGAGGDGQEATGAVRDSRIARLSVFDSELVRHGPLVKRTSWELPAWVHGPSRVPDAERPPSPRARFDNAAPLHATHLVSSAVTRHRASSLRFSLPDEEHSGGASSLLSEQAIFAPPHELPQQQLQQQESPDEWLMREAADLSAASDMPAADVAVEPLESECVCTDPPARRS
ncbi:hypothetical protein FA09DRAFT_198466 [Tilletiopsis washingtonensis]|uniref:Uncharacterized protein n=1 Tax=Tilletiopsis washingtonensis TaxID=58919 RepID=A0A316ZEG7_9BASI|nr:hypothetical protein FA09DRAFT_198466 [Tilletiopsis washingtonensis]PWN99911.1 hypothetical protein FA09DRAFT_198466 [Tilletiopsis washingtonensis]